MTPRAFQARIGRQTSFCSGRNKTGYVTDPFSVITIDGSFWWMLRPDNRANGRVLGAVWFDLGGTNAAGSVKIADTT